MSLCRICSANDEEALIEDVAKAMWDTQMSSNPYDVWRPWDQSEGYWQTIMRQFATATVAALRAQHQA